MSIRPLDHRAGSSVKSLDIAFMAANAVGIVLYLVLASLSWRIPQEHGMVPVTGEPFVWAGALPVLGVFLLADIVWGGLLLRDREYKRRLWWLITAAVWLLAIGIDFSRHLFRLVTVSAPGGPNRPERGHARYQRPIAWHILFWPHLPLASHSLRH
jgi:hypothetical protein